MKGGTLLYAVEQEKSRPTLDIDFLAFDINNDQDNFKSIFSEICLIEYGDDCVTFNVSTISTSEITKEDNYSGVRVKIEANLGNIRQNLQIDIGFGDIIIPEPVNMVYPTLLDIDAPNIQAYSLESVIAEKFEAMIDLAEANSRMKDFYDVYKLLESSRIDNGILEEAISQTFKRRNTPFTQSHSLFNDVFANDEQRNRHFKAFLKKLKLDESIQFLDVMKIIKINLQPIYERL